MKAVRFLLSARANDNLNDGRSRVTSIVSRLQVHRETTYLANIAGDMVTGYFKLSVASLGVDTMRLPAQ